MTTTRRLPTYFLTHGGGPWPWMKPEFGTAFDKLEASLVKVRREIGEAPRAILMISGHWVADQFLVSSNEKPPMVYDFDGFPARTYQIRYDAPGAPDLAAQVQAMLEDGGIHAGLAPDRGFDHGAYTVMFPMYPEAKVPLVQLSLRSDFDADAHLEVGKLLSPLRDEGVLIVGSGSSYHDLRGLLSGAGAKAAAAFDKWLADTLLASSPDAYRAGLRQWATAPSAQSSHPDPDHLLPLMIAAGAAGEDVAHRIFHQNDFMGAISLSSFRFGHVAAFAGEIK